MLKLRKLATVLLAGLVIFALGLPVKDTHSLPTTADSSKLILDGGFDVIPDGAGNFYILSYSNYSENCSLTYCNNSGDTPVLSSDTISGSLSKGYFAIRSAFPYVYLFYPTSIIQLQVSSMSSSTQSYSSGLSLDTTKYSQGLAVGANNDVFMCASDSNSVSVYTPDLKADTQLTTDGTIAAITTDPSNNYLYAATNDKLYRYKIGDTNYTFADVFIPHGVAPFKFLTDSLFITSAGKIYSLEKTWEKSDVPPSMQVTMADYDKGVAITGFDNTSILAKTASTTVSRVSCSDGKVICSKTFDDKVVAVSTSGTKTIVITDKAGVKSIHLVAEEDFPTPKDEEVTPPGGDGTDPDNPNPDTPSDPLGGTTIGSTEGYEVGENVISKIPAGTTWGTLRNGLEANYITVELNGKGNATTSTKVATGHKITFIFDNERKVTKTFTLIVEGDVTGSGNISSKSISALANHLLGKSELDGVFLEAANLSGDGDLSTVDLLLMYKQTQK